MGMPADHFLCDAVNDILKGKFAHFFGNLAVQHHLQEQIPQFLTQVGRIAGGGQITHRLIDFIGFFYGIALHALVGLRPVPGTAVLAAESGDHRMKFFKSKLSVHHTLRSVTIFL